MAAKQRGSSQTVNAGNTKRGATNIAMHKSCLHVDCSVAETKQLAAALLQWTAANVSSAAMLTLTRINLHKCIGQGFAKSPMSKPPHSSARDARLCARCICASSRTMLAPTRRFHGAAIASMCMTSAAICRQHVPNVRCTNRPTTASASSDRNPPAL